MPSPAQEFESLQRPEMHDSGGNPDVDAVLTTRELARMIKMAGASTSRSPDGEVDAPLGLSSGAADIFANTGGVMEAALRTAYEFVTGQDFPFENLHVKPIAGLEGVKEASITIGETVPETWSFLKGATLKGRRGPRLLQRPEGDRPDQERRERVPLRRGHDLPRWLHRWRRPAAPDLRRDPPEENPGHLRGRPSASCASLTRTLL